MEKRKIKFIIGVILFMGIMGMFDVFLHSKEHMPIERKREKNINNVNEITNLESEGKFAFLQEVLLCDDVHAVKIAEDFENATGKQLEWVEVIPTRKKSIILRTGTEEKSYYLKVNSVKVLNEIREDSMTGKIIFQIIY